MANYLNVFLGMCILLFACKIPRSNNEEVNLDDYVGDGKEYPVNLIISKPDYKRYEEFINFSKALKENAPKDIVFIFVDTLRSDYSTKEIAQNITSLKEESLSFEKTISSSTITHNSTYSIFYSEPALYRDYNLQKKWKLGSPFLRRLKKLGYKIKVYGSPWQGCFETNRFYNSEEELQNYAASNLQTLYGLNPSAFIDYCYKGGGDNKPQIKPYINETRVDDSGIQWSHQAYLDHAVTNDIIDEIKRNSDKQRRNFYFYYLSSVHDPYAWMENGLPDGNPTPYEIDTPNLPWTVDWKAYRKKNPDDNFIKSIHNSYKNAVRGADYQIGRLLKTLKQEEKYSDSVIVLVSDHGEFLYEKELEPFTSRIGHCCEPYTMNTHVVQMIKFPGDNTPENKIRRKLGTHLDLWPTLFSILEENNKTPGVGKSATNSYRKCFHSFNPAGKVMPSDFYITNGDYYAYFRGNFEDELSLKSLRIKFIKNAEDKVIEATPTIEHVAEYVPSYDKCLSEIFGESILEKLTPHRCKSYKHADYSSAKDKEMILTYFDQLGEDFVKYEPQRDIKEVPTTFDDLNEVPLIKESWSNEEVKFLFDEQYFRPLLAKKGDKDYEKKFYKIPRVSGFTFVGRRESPKQMKRKNGLCDADDNQVDIIDYYYDAKIPGWVSTTRSPIVAKWYISYRGKGEQKEGYIYVTHVEGGFDDQPASVKLKYVNEFNTPMTMEERWDLAADVVSRMKTYPILFSPYLNQEVAQRSGLDFSKFVGYRKVVDDKFSGPIMIRENFEKFQPRAFKKIRCYLSGGNKDACEKN